MSIRSKLSKLFDDAKAIALDLYDQHFGPEMIEGTELLPIQVKLTDEAEFMLEVRPTTRSRIYALKAFMEPGVAEVTSFRSTMDNGINRICASIDASYWNTESISGVPFDGGEADPDHPIKITFKACRDPESSDMLNMVVLAVPIEIFEMREDKPVAA
jgi:hypothetical protein